MDQRNKIQGILTALCAIFLGLCFVPGWSVLAYVSVLAGSYFALNSALASLKAREIDVNLLMVLAAAGAVAVGQPSDAAALLFLFSLSSTLEVFAMARTRNAIEGLVKLRPSEAILITSEGDARVPVESLKIGDQIRVVPFSAFPVDGTVNEGTTSVDQSAMTGESHAIPRLVGDRVISGTQNLEGTIVVSVESTVGDSALDRIVALVEDAQENKASGERISKWFGEKYTIFVIVVFAISVVVRLVLGLHFMAALAASLTLLVALSPCALVISTPASTLSALAWAARNGILIRGGEFIELAGSINTIALDKTGTLTHGRPTLKEICVCTTSAAPVVGGVAVCKDGDVCWAGQGEMSDEAKRVLQFAAAAEQYSNHPLAEAIVRASTERGLALLTAANQKVVPAMGVIADVDGKQVKVGQISFFEGSLGDDFLAHVHEIQQAGMTAVVAEVDGEFGALGIVDGIRPESKDVIARFHAHGIHDVEMLTGDSEITAKAVATEVGIDKHYAALLPADKERIIDELCASGRRVMMVGDGVNDAPSLARSTVGVAMGGLGSDIALNAADIVLMNDKLSLIPRIIDLGKFTNAVIRTNLIFATSVIVVLTITSLTGRLPLPIAVIGHEGSTVLVILNGLRLLRGPK